MNSHWFNQFHYTHLALVAFDSFFNLTDAYKLRNGRRDQKRRSLRRKTHAIVEFDRAIFKRPGFIWPK